MRIFLDDERLPPIDGNVWVTLRSYDQFVNYVTMFGAPDFVSFDHDLGEGKNGMDCAKFLVEYCLDHGASTVNFYVHSQNPVGAENIRSLLTSYNNTIKRN